MHSKEHRYDRFGRTGESDRGSHGSPEVKYPHSIFTGVPPMLVSLNNPFVPLEDYLLGEADHPIKHEYQDGDIYLGSGMEARMETVHAFCDPDVRLKRAPCDRALSFERSIHDEPETPFI
jgi:hypothetical protein